MSTTGRLDHSRYYAIIVGIDQYRDPWPQAHQIPRRHLKGLLDTLRTTGTFPKEQTRVLHGSHATRADIEEVLLSWARNHMQPNSVLLFYFAGHAVADPESGDVFLVPYEGIPQGFQEAVGLLKKSPTGAGKIEDSTLPPAIRHARGPISQYRPWGWSKWESSRKLARESLIPFESANKSGHPGQNHLG